MDALVVDDDQVITGMVATLLTLEGFAVRECADGAAALRSMRTRRPDVVVLDVMMPGMDGLTVLSEMRSDDTLHAVPVVIMSAKGSDQDIWEGWSRGTDSYVTKPFDPDVLVSEVLRVATSD